MNDPKRPNNTEQRAACIVRWMLETPGGWLGAWDRSAFDAHLAPLTAEVAELRHTLALQHASYEREREIDQEEIERLRAELEALKGRA